MIYTNSFNVCVENFKPNINLPNLDNKTIINNIETPIALSIIININDKKEKKPITVIEPRKNFNIPEKYLKYEKWLICLPKINGNDVDFSAGYCFKFNINEINSITTAETLCQTDNLIKKNKSPTSPNRSSLRGSGNINRSSNSINYSRKKSIDNSFKLKKNYYNN